MSRIKALFHVAPKDGISTVYASVEYPVDSAPVTIEIDGTTYREERRVKRDWNDRWGVYECPYCQGQDMTNAMYCPICGVRFIGFNGGPKND